MSELLADRLNLVKPSKISAFFDKVSQTKGAISLSIGEPDFPTPWHIADTGIASIEEGNTFYTSDMGLLELRQAIASFLKRHYSLSYSSNEILVTVGASEAIDLALRAIINPGDEVALLNPSYVSYLPCVTLAGGKAILIPLKEENRFKLQVTDLERLVTTKTKALILNYPHNPTGAIMSKEELEPIAEFCYKHHIFIISD
jgi:aminotransferase